jgi:hypothetical protein
MPRNDPFEVCECSAVAQRKAASAHGLASLIVDLVILMIAAVRRQSGFQQAGASFAGASPCTRGSADYPIKGV